jgi:lipoate-protein ligase B
MLPATSATRLAVGEVWLLDLGLVEYGAAYELQCRLLAERDADRVPDLLLLVEHPPVITLGRRGSRDDVFLSDNELAARGIAIYETNRGGLVTYHGPGQIVGYPIARLRALAGDAPTYVSRLEETIVRTLANFGIAAGRDPGNRGVFAERGKIAAIGVAVSHGVTMHGFALNVCPNLDHFTLIDPCGIGNLGVTSIDQILASADAATSSSACQADRAGFQFSTSRGQEGRAPAPGTSVDRPFGGVPDLDSVRRALADQFGSVFGRTVRPAPSSLWELIGSWGLLETPASATEIRLIHS